MKKVFKYTFEPNDFMIFSLPNNAKILTIQEQLGTLCLWALVDPEEPVMKQVNIRMVGTGHPIMEDGKYISSVQVFGGTMIFHFFDVTVGV
jgi:hypothetical protein